MGKLRASEAAALMQQLRAVQENVAGLRVMIESRGTGDVRFSPLQGANLEIVRFFCKITCVTPRLHCLRRM